MWCLKGGFGDRPQPDIYLVPGTLVVGRLGTEVELDDKSVSRRHAKLVLSPPAEGSTLRLEGVSLDFAAHSAVEPVLTRMPSWQRRSEPQIWDIY